MSELNYLAVSIAKRLVERHSDVLLGVEQLRPRLDGQHVVFRDGEAAVDALARDILEVLEVDALMTQVPIKHVPKEAGEARAPKVRRTTMEGAA